MRSLNHLRIARLVFFLEIGGGRDSYVTGAGTNFIRVVTAAKYFALSSALYSHTISCVCRHCKVEVEGIFQGIRKNIACSRWNVSEKRKLAPKTFRLEAKQH